MGGACCSEVGKAAPQQAGNYGGPDYVVPAPAPDWASMPPQRDLQPVKAASGKAAGSATSTAAPASSGRQGGGPDQFISVVGELPTFDKSKKGHYDDMSSEISTGTVVSGISELADAAAEKEQRQQAKVVVKDFVKAMVKGRKMNVIAPDGSLKTCSASLSRGLDQLRIKVKSNSRSIPLKDIEEIHAGADVDGVSIQTPLDELCATLMLPSEESITFRMSDINDRDTFIMCLLMFCNNQK